MWDKTSHFEVVIIAAHSVRERYAEEWLLRVGNIEIGRSKGRCSTVQMWENTSRFMGYKRAA